MLPLREYYREAHCFATRTAFRRNIYHFGERIAHVAYFAVMLSEGHSIAVILLGLTVYSIFYEE